MLRDKINIATMSLDKKKPNTLSDIVPDTVVYFAKFVEELFVSNDPMQMLTDYRAFLRKCEGSRVQNVSTVPDGFEFEDAPMRTEEFIEAVKGKKREYTEAESVADLFG
jgi:FAD synthase